MNVPAHGLAVPARLLNSAYFVWLLLALPGLVMSWRYWQGTSFYGEYLHATGELSAQLLIATLAVTPLRLLFPRAGWPRWLLARRRYLGVAAFGYAVLHAGAYLFRQPFSVIAGDALTAAMWTGWLALFLLLALALTSNDLSLRLLRRGWKRLHRAVYVAALLSFVHWILAAFDPVPGMLHLGVLAALEGYRLSHVFRHRRSPHTA